MSTKYQINQASGPVLMSDSLLKQQLKLAKAALESTQKGTARHKLWLAYQAQLLRFKEINDL